MHTNTQLLINPDYLRIKGFSSIIYVSFLFETFYKYKKQLFVNKLLPYTNTLVTITIYFKIN